MSLARSFSRFRNRIRNVHGKKKIPLRQNKILLEPLEPRLLLASDLVYAAAAGAAADLTLRLERVAEVDTLQIINNNDTDPATRIVANQALADTSGVVITVTEESDRLRIDLDLEALSDPLPISFSGGEGYDTLDFAAIQDDLLFIARQTGDITIANGEFTVNEDGTVSVAGESSNTTGTGVENLIGGEGDNTFVFEDGAILAGAIDGGTEGDNTLDYSAYAATNPVTVDLSSGIATGTGGVSHIHNVIGGAGDDTLTGTSGDNILSGGPGNDTLNGLGGGDILAGDAGDDTLMGPEGDSIWEIQGANEGTLNYETEFASIENLTGNAHNQDGFVIFAEGSISGTISGGEGGSDGFIVEDPAEEGPLTVVNPDASGAGTVTLYGKTVNYAGMDPIVETGSAGAVIIHGSVYNDEWILEAAPQAGRMQIRDLSGDFYDAGSGSFVSSLSFDSSTASLLIRLGLGEDALTIGAFDPGFAADVTVEGGTGVDDLTGSNDANAWEITGANAGLLNSRIHFSGIEDLMGGGGPDDFVFADGADVDGVIDGGSGGPNRLDYHLTTSDVTIALGIEVDNIDVFVGGLGTDTLYGVEEDATWNITGMGEGRVTAATPEGTTVVDAVFSGFENLAGRTGNDTFLFANGMGLQGIIDGGGGTNTLDYSAYGAGHAVTVNLGSGGATGASRVQNIQAIKGGAGNDTLLGPEQTARWNISGVNSGYVEGVLFATEQSGDVHFDNIENLRGAADHEDGFIFATGGSLDGGIDGGAGGRDILAIENPGTPGAFVAIDPSATGSGVVHVGDLFSGDLRSIPYAGMEPGFEIDTTDPAEVSIFKSILFPSGSFALEAGPGAGELQLRPIENAWVWNSEAGFSNSVTQVFDAPSDSLTLALGHSSLTVNSLELPGADLILSCGTLSFAGEILTHGGSLTVTAENVTVTAGTLISTRDTVGDPETGPSIGSSGDLSISGKTIKVESGARILAFDDLASVDSDHIPSGIDSQSAAQVKWTADKTHSALATTSAAGGTGLTVDVVTDSQGNPTAFLRDRGTGYTAGDTLSIAAPDGVGSPITVRVSGLLNDGGDISLSVNDRFQTWVYVPSNANAWIEIDDALLKGRNIRIQAEADNDSIFDGEKNRAEQIGESAIDFLAGISPFVGYANAKASASVLIGSGTVLQSDADVNVAAHANSEANLMTLGIGACVAYARSEANATVTLEEDAAIHAAGGVLLKAATDNTLTVTAMNILGTTPDFMGKTLGDKAIPVHITFAWTEAYAHATATVAEGAVITAGEYVDVQALTTKNLSSSSSGGGDFDALGAGVLVALSDSTADAVIKGSVTTARGNVLVEAKTEAEKNVTKAQSLVGGGWFEKGMDYLSNASPKKFGTEIFKAFGTWGYEKLKDKFDKPPEKLSDIKTRPRSNTVTEEPTQRFSEKLSKFGGSVAFAWSEQSSSATAKIGSTAVVNSGGGVIVNSEVVERPDITAASVVGSAKDKNYKAKDNKKDVKKEYSGSIAVLVGDYTNTSTALIEGGAEVDARGAIRVQAETKIPYQDWLYNMKQTFGEDYTNLVSRLVSEDIGPNSFVTSWGLSAAEGKKAGVAGSATILLINDTATARIAEGALINQNIDATGQDVYVTADNTFEAFTLVGTYSKILEKVKLDSKEGLKNQDQGDEGSGNSAGVGGSFGGFFYTNTTTAAIESGARVNADSLTVDAQATINNVTLGVAAGNPGGTFGVNGVVTLVDMANHTLAKIDDGATVTADGAVKVTALDDVMNVNIVGGVSQGRSLGFGITAGIDLIDRETKAIIGNEEAVLGRGEFAPNTGVNDAENTVDLGYAHGFHTGDAVVYSNGGDDSIGGLVDGDTYYVRVVNARAVGLARSVAEAGETAAARFSPAQVEDSGETLDLGYSHGYQTGDAVVYHNGGGISIGGLNDGQTYYIIRVSETEVRLAGLKDDALAANPVPVDLDLTLGGAGTNHTLRLDLSPAAGGGTAHSFGRAFDLSTAVDGEEGTINLGYVHGFTTGDRVTYSHGGGKSIGGLENKETYYAIMVNSTTLRLAESRAQALEGISLDLDPSVAEGALHTIGVGFRPMPSVDGATETIRFEGAHGFREGQALVYESGGGAPIGGLTSGDTYYVNNVNADTIRLARSVLEAKEDAATFFGAGDLGSAGGSGTVIDLGYDHGFKTGDAVVYDNGGGASIGGLNEGRTYYLIWESDTEIKLAENPGGDARTLDPATGSGTAHSLRLALDPAAATGTGHRFFEPDDVNGSLSAGGMTTVSAANTGVVVDVSLAASRTGDKGSAKEEKNGKEGKGGGGKYGVALSGSASANTLFDTTEAYIADSVILHSGGLEVNAKESTTIVSIAGAGAFSTNQKGTFGLAGAVTVNWIDNGTHAYIHNSVLEDIGALTVHSESTGRIYGIAAGLSGATRGAGIAGSVAVNLIFGDTDAYVDGGSAVSGAANVSITAKDTSSILTVAGAIAYGGKAGIGAGVAVNYIDSSTDAYAADSDIIAGGTVTVGAENDADILAIAAAVGIGGGEGTWAGAAAVSVAVNLISNDAHAYILGNRSDDGIDAGGSVSITATDTSDIEVIAGGVAIAFGKSPGGENKDKKKADDSSAAFALGAAIAVNDIRNSVSAVIEDSIVTSGGNVSLVATSTPTIYALTIGGAVAFGSSSEKSGFAFAGAGAGSGNTIQDTTVAAIQNGSTVETTGTATVTATDTSKITADAGGVAIAISSGGKKSGVALSIGMSMALNEIANGVSAVIDDSSVLSGGNVGLTATSAATIDALTIGGAVAVGASGNKTGFAFAGAGAGSGNTIQNTIEAAIMNGSTVTATGTGAVLLTALDASAIVADAGGVSIAVGASSQGTGAALSVGVSIADNLIENKAKAYIDEATVTAAGNLELTAVSAAKIDALTIAGAVGVGASATKGGYAGAGAGAASYNEVTNTVEAYIKDAQSVRSTGGSLKITAVDGLPLFIPTETLADPYEGEGLLPAAWRTAFAAPGRGITLSNDVTVTVRAPGREWLIKDNDEGETYLVIKEQGKYRVLKPTVITADGGGVAIGVGASAGQSTGGALSIGVSLAENTIDNTIRAYIDHSTLPRVTPLSFAGDILLEAASMAEIDSLTIGGAIAVGASGGGSGYAGAGTGAAAYNDIGNTIESYLKGVGSITSSTGGLTLTAADNAAIVAKAIGGSIAVGASGTSTGGALSIGVSIAHNTIADSAQAYIDESALAAPANKIRVKAGEISLRATSMDTIDALSIAASIGVGAAVEKGVALSGGGSESTNIILTKTNAFILGADLKARGDMVLEARNASDITAQVITGSLAVGAGGTTGVSASVGASLAQNIIGWDQDGVFTPAEVQAYLRGSSVDTQGDLRLTANASEKIDAVIVAGSVAISGAGTTGVGLSGAGADGENKIAAKVKAFIEGGGATGITADSVSLTAQDSSTITADVVGGSLAGAFAGTTGVALSVGVALAYNEVRNDIAAYIQDAGSGVTSRSGGILLTAGETATITALSIAASVSLGFAGTTGVALSGAGAETTNVILTGTQAYVEDSNLLSAGDVLLYAGNASTITAKIFTGTLAAGIGGTTGVGASIGASLARNLIGWDADGNYVPAKVQAYVQDSSIAAAGDLTQTAVADETIKAIVVAGSVAIAGGGTAGVGLSGSGADGSNKISTQVKAFIDGDGDTGIFADNILLTALDFSDITADVAAGSLAASFAGTGAGSLSIGVALAANNIANRVEAFIANADEVTAVDGSVILTAADNATIDALSVAASLSAAFSGGVGIALSGAGAVAHNTIANTVKAYIASSNIAVPGIFYYTQQDLPTQIIQGDRVRLNAGNIYEYVGATPLSGPVDLGAQNYSDAALWKLVFYTQQVHPASIVQGDRIWLDNGEAYEYAGANPLSGPADFGAQAYTNTALWKPVNDIVVDALSLSTVTALVGGVSAAISAGQVAAAGSIGVALLDNNVLNQISAYILDSTVSSADDISVRAKAIDSVDAVAFSGSVAIAGGPGGALAGCGVEVTNLLTSGVSAYLLDTAAAAADDIEVKAVSDSHVLKSQAIGVAVAASLGSVSVGVSLVDNQIGNTVQAYAAAPYDYTLLDEPASLAAGKRVRLDNGDIYEYTGLTPLSGPVDLTVQDYADAAQWVRVRETNLTAGGDISILADAERARVSDATATTVSATAGVVGLSGGGIDIGNSIANTVNAYVGGPVQATADGDVSVVARENAYIVSDATVVSVSVSLGVGLGVALVENEIGSSIQAWVWGAAVSSDNTYIHADSVANVDKTVSFGISGSAIAGAQGNEATASIKTLVKAFAENAQLTSIHDVDIQASASNIANAKTNGGAFGAIAVGAMVSDVNLGKGYDIYEVESAVGTGTVVRAGTLRITAVSSDNLLAVSIAGGGGAVAAAGAESDVTSDQATLARIGEGARIDAGGLAVNSLHTQDFDSSADSCAFALAAGSGAGVSNTLTTKANVEIGAGATVNAGNILIAAKNQLTKDEYKDRSNLYSGSASLGNVSVLLSETSIGKTIDDVYRPFESVVTIGQGAKLAVEGDNQNPGVLKIEALNKITAYDLTRVESVSGFSIGVGISRVESDSLAAINLDGATLESNAGDVYLTAKTDSLVSTSANLLVATALTGGAGAEATTTTKAANQINVNNGTIKGGDLYLYAGRDSSETSDIINAFANVELVAMSMFPNIAVPIPTADITESNTVQIGGASSLRALQDVNVVTEEGIGGLERRRTDGLALSLSLIPYGFPIPGYGDVVSTNTVTIGDQAKIEAGINNQAILRVLPVSFQGQQNIDPARLEAAAADRALTAAEKIKERVTYVSISGEDVVRVVDGANKGGVAGDRYAYVGQPAEMVLSEEDYTDAARWTNVTATTTEGDVTYASDYVTDVQYEYCALNADEVAFVVYTGTVIQVADDGAGNPVAGKGEIGALYRYRPESNDPTRIILDQEDFTNTLRWEKIVIAYDLATIQGSVALQRGQIVKTAQNQLFRYLGANSASVDLNQEDFANGERWGQIGPDIYQSEVTISFRETLRNKFYVVKPTRVEIPTLSLQNVGDILLAQRRDILDWIANHSSNAEAVARYEIELALVEDTLAELGLMDVYSDPSTGETVRVANEGLDVLFLDLPDVYAAPGSIFIKADEASRSSFAPMVDDQLLARAGAKIAVFNETPFSMTLSDLVIRDTKRVAVVDGQYTVLAPGNVYFNNLGLTAVQDPGSKNISVMQDSLTRNAADYGLNVDIPEKIGQDLYVLGQVVNEVGGVTLINNEGSINVSGEIRAQNVLIRAAEDFNLTQDWFHNMDPRDYPGLDALRGLVFNDAGTLRTRTYPEGQNPFVNGLDPWDGAVVAQGRVAVNARYLNINGVIQSGVQTITLFVDAGFAPKGTTSFLDDDGNPIQGITFGDDGVPVDGYFDAQKGAIVVNEIVPEGGVIDLTGQILSTGNGLIRAAHGTSDVNIQNHSRYDLVVNRIDTTVERKGKITITDTARLQKVVYEVEGDQVLETAFQGTLNPNPADGRPRILYEQIGSSDPHDLSETMQYEPRTGLYYMWTEGQEKTRVVQTYYAKRSFNLIGFDWNALAKDESYVWRKTEYRDAYPLLESEILALDPNYVEPSAPTQTGVTLETGQTVKNAEGEVYMYQGARAENFDLTAADFTDASLWVRAIEIPSYANDKDYAIQFELRKDTDVELYQDVSIIKLVNDATGKLMGKSGTAGHYYRYIGTNAELVLQDQYYADAANWQDLGTNWTGGYNYDSSFLNYSFEVSTWTTGGGWMRYKTVHMLTNQIFGEKDYYTHTLRADYPIDVQFLQGPDDPSIYVESAHDLYLQGTVNAPENGAVSLVSTAGSVIFGDEAAVLGVSPVIQAARSVRLNVEGGIAPNLVSAGPTRGPEDAQGLSITTPGDIEIRVVYDPYGNQSSTLIVGRVISTGGNVILHAGDGIQPFDDSSLIRGNRIELYARQGSIGGLAMPLQVDSDALGSGGVAANARGDIYLRETAGDLKLAEPQSWEDVQASIHSEQGDVVLETVNGSILDAYYEEFRPLTAEEAAALDQKLKLTGQQAQEAAEASIRAEENTRTQLYHTYWETYRNAQPGAVLHEMRVESIDALQNTILFSEAHGLMTGDQVFFDVSGEGSHLPYVNVEKGSPYYAVVVNETTIRLALTRYDAAISATPVVLDIRVEGADNVVLRRDQGDFSGVSLQERAYTYGDLQQDPSDLSAAYRGIHDTYGGGAYDPNFLYRISAQERQERIAARTFSTGALRYQISQSLFDFLYPDAEEGGGVEAPAEMPNVISNHLTLRAGGGNGQIGRVTGLVTIDLSRGFENLTADEQKILTYAGVDDVVRVTYAQGPLGEDRNKIVSLTLQVWNDVDVEAPEGVDIAAGAGVALETTGDLAVESIAAGGNVRLVAGGDILDLYAPGTDAAVAAAGNLNLRAEDWIGAENGMDPFRIQVGAPGRLGAEVTGTLHIEQVAADATIDGELLAISHLSTSRVHADGEVEIAVREGNLNVGDVSSEVSVTLQADGGIFDASADDGSTRDRNVSAPEAYLLAGTGGGVDGSIGSANNYLEIDLQEGRLIALADQNIYLHEIGGNMRVDAVTSAHGKVGLKAAGSILETDEGTAGNPLIDVYGNDITLVAESGTIGAPDDELEIDSAFSSSGAFSSFSALETYVVEQLGDLHLGTVQTNGSTAYINAPGGSILNGDPGGVNLRSGRAYLHAAAQIGAADDRLVTEVENFEGLAEGGGVWIGNIGPLTVGGVTGMEGIRAAGSVVIGASSPITITENIEGGDIDLEAGDDAADGVGGTDDLILRSGVTLWAKDGHVTLKAGDNLTLEEGSAVRAVTSVRLYGDYGNADPGDGAVLAPRGQIIAPRVEIYGEADEDLFDIRMVSIPAAIAAGEGTDTLIGPDGNSAWEITGPDSGNLNGTIAFASAGNLIAGSGDDTFYFRGPGSVSGIVDGGAGFDILDFLQSDFIQEAAEDFLDVDLPIGDEVVNFTATGGITRIEDILVILLAEVQPDGTLVLNMGPRAAERLTVNTEDGDEVFLLSHVAGDPADAAGETIRVSAFGFDLEYEGVRSIRGSGGQGDDQILLAGDVLAPAELDGGLGNDTLRGGGGGDILLGDSGIMTRSQNEDGTPRRDVLLTDVGMITGSYNLNDVAWRNLKPAVVSGILNADLALLTGAYNADGSKHLVPYSCWAREWETQLLLVSLLEDGNDVLDGGAGDDAIFGGRGDDLLTGGIGGDYLVGNAGNDTLEGAEGADILVGDDATQVVSNGPLPNVQRGLHLINGNGKVGGFVLGDLGTTVVPIVSVLPGQVSNPLMEVFAQAGCDLPRLPGDNVLKRADGTYLAPLASIVTDVAGHLDLLAGNDKLFGGAGEDTLVGDDLVVFAPRVSVTEATLDSAAGVTRDLLAATDDLGGFIDRLHRAVDRFNHHFPCYGHADVIVDRVFYLGNDKLEGGIGNDFLVGDQMTVTAPSFAIRSALTGDFHHLVHDLEEAGERAGWALAELDDLAHDLRDVVVPGRQGWHLSRTLEHHLDRIVWGNDSLVGGDGDDVMTGDNWSLLSPRIAVSPGGEQSWCGYPGWGCGDTPRTRGWDDKWRQSSCRHDGPRDQWFGGNDELNGGAGSDLLFGDSVRLFAPAMAIGPGFGWWDSIVLRHEAGEILGDLVTAGRPEPFASAWFGRDDGHGGFGGDCWSAAGGNDILRGGSGDDILFGQSGDDALFGDTGNDWLVGGHGDNRLDGGGGKDRVKYGSDCSRELWDKVRTHLNDYAGRVGDLLGSGNAVVAGAKIVPCSEWVKDFVIDLGGSSGTRDPNREIKIVLS